jgi:hypothetical protein
MNSDTAEVLTVFAPVSAAKLSFQDLQLPNRTSNKFYVNIRTVPLIHKEFDLLRT